MRICVFGAGAVGGHFAARLAAAGNEVSVVARGANLAAIRERGIVLEVKDQRIVGRVRATERPEELGEQDLVLSTLKAPSLPSLAASITPLLGKETAVIFAQNGIPWWYAQGLAPSRPKPPALPRLDPDDALRGAVASERIIGGVIYSSNVMTAPGIVANGAPYRSQLLIGEAGDRASPRIAALRATLAAAGIDSPAVADIRTAIWRKLLINSSGSTLALLTRSPAIAIAQDASLGEIFARLFREGLATCAAHGIDFGAEPPDPAVVRRGLPDHKPSILQDYELGRTMEIDAMVLAPHAFARSAGVATPTLDVIAALATRLAGAKGLYAL